MTAMQMNETAGWVPEFEFEVWSLGIDCKKFHADCCRNLAKTVSSEEDVQKLHNMAERQESEVNALSSRINNMLDKLLGDFYANGGQVMSGSLKEDAKNQIRNYLNEIEAYEREASCTITNQEFGAAVEFAEKQDRYYRQMFRQLADLYPEGEVKGALTQLAEL